MKDIKIWPILLMLPMLTIVLLVSCATAAQTITVTQTAEGRDITRTTTVTSTVTNYSTTTVAGPAATTFVTTVATTPPATTAATEQDPPPTPHSLALGTGMEGMCFTCHSIPPGHEGRSAIEAFCHTCHYEAPPSEWTINE